MTARIEREQSTMEKVLERLGRGFRPELTGARRTVAVVAGVLAPIAFSLWAINEGGSRLFLQRLFDALSNGFIYSTIALSVVIIYKSTTVVNFAQGNMAMFGTFIAYVLVVEQGLNIILGIAIAMALSAVGGALIERLFIRPFDPSDHLPIIIMTLAWYLILAAVAAVIWAFDPRAFPSPFPRGIDDFIEIGGARLQYSDLGTWITVLVAVVVVTQLLQRTKIGLAFRAVSTNLYSSALVGIRIGRIQQLGWALAAAIGTLAGCLVAPELLLDPNYMNRFLIFAFAAATLGGLDSLGGAVVGGILIGLIQTMAGGYVPWIGSDFALASALVVIVLILVIRPNGLFGSTKVERV